MSLQLSQFFPLCTPLPGTPFHSRNSPTVNCYLMSMGHTYKFFAFSISCTIFNIPLSILYLPFMFFNPYTSPSLFKWYHFHPLECLVGNSCYLFLKVSPHGGLRLLSLSLSPSASNLLNLGREMCLCLIRGFGKNNWSHGALPSFFLCR